MNAFIRLIVVKLMEQPENRTPLWQKLEISGLFWDTVSECLERQADYNNDQKQ